MNRLSKKAIFFLLLCLIIILGIVQNTCKKDELEKFGIRTTGIVIKFSFIRKTDYKLEYKYNVNGIDYYSSEITSKFQCDDGSKGCVGKRFVVIYSKKNPNLSTILLDKYTKFKKTHPSL